MNLKNKRVLVTGSEGFIGSHLVEALLAKGACVRAFVYYNSFNSWGWIETFSDDKKKAIDIFSGDVRDPNGVKEAMKGCDIVFHLAALIGIPFSYHSPDSYAETNIKGTLNVLQAARDLSTERVLITSTSEVYGTAQYVPIDESHAIQPQSPYSATKIGADCIAESFYRSFDLPVTIVRPFNTYGPRQSARAIIPTIIIQAASGKKLIRLGSLKPTRDLSYVEDVCAGFIALAECAKAVGEIVNIGSNSEISIGGLADKIKKIMHSNAKVITDKERFRPPKSEVYRLRCDNTKIRNLTGFVPKYSIQEGLKKTISWFTNPENLKNYKPDIYNV